MSTYPTLNVAVYALRKKGYRLNFYKQADFIFCFPTNLKELFEDVKIDEVHSFPAQNQPGKRSEVSAITLQNGTRGILFECSENHREQVISSYKAATCLS